ncbi:MAG: hypothetical protein KDA96_21515 [Planctomycetaceae bacterium]|nr:hypothetical protein [Planctomycetaceae bacterium]
MFCCHSFRNSLRAILTSGLLLAGLVPPATAQLDYEQDPINYSTRQPDDAIQHLMQRLEKGEAKLVWDKEHGYLKSMLENLGISQSSQTLVFSKTSLQISRITPRTPRAVYFNDDVYIGWVQDGDVIEISAADPHLGGTFYVMDQRNPDEPVIRRETARCLQCHGSTHTRRTPGHMVRSVYSDRGGIPVYRLGTHLNEDRSPFSERWGGWYVSGSHGKQRHMGNVTIDQEGEIEDLDVESGANVTDLSRFFDTKPYLTPYSDIVAMMVLQHQSNMHNIITAANHSGQLTARDALIMNRALERADDFQSESTIRRYASAAEKVIQGLLFCREYELTDPVSGPTTFQADFEARGPFDRQGRSLRQFDLQTRMFRYPCSFLIYTDSFRNLPEGVRSVVWRRLHEVLSGQDTSPEFAHLSSEDRRAILEILQDTCPELQQVVTSLAVK